MLGLPTFENERLTPSSTASGFSDCSEVDLAEARILVQSGSSRRRTPKVDKGS